MYSSSLFFLLLLLLLNSSLSSLIIRNLEAWSGGGTDEWFEVKDEQAEDSLDSDGEISLNDERMIFGGELKKDPSNDSLPSPESAGLVKSTRTTLSSPLLPR